MSQNSVTPNPTPAAIKKRPPYLQFSFPWKIKWSNFQDLSTKEITKEINTSYNNVVFYWQTRLSVTIFPKTKSDKFSLSLRYMDGPVAKFGDMEYSVVIFKTGQAMEYFKTKEYEASRGLGEGWPDFDDRDIKDFQQKYGLVDSKFLMLQITLKIPFSVFTKAQRFGYEMKSQVGEPLVSVNLWPSQLFSCIDGPEKSSFWDCKLKSRDDVIFYGHRVILGRQSEPLAAMFNFLPNANLREAEFPFPSLSGESLKALFEYLYTNRVQLIGLSTTDVIEIGDAAEQYALNELKKLCTAVLWDRAVEKPEECFVIIQFTDLHQDMKYVKHRALDVLADNYENFNLASDAQAIRFGENTGGRRLKLEFNLFFSRRLLPRFCEKITK